MNHARAQNSLDDRKHALELSFSLLERDLSVFGVTAIEDHLQDSVPETIKLLQNAGIKIWMLTGDGRETAVQVAFSCNLLLSAENIFHLRVEGLVDDGDGGAEECGDVGGGGGEHQIDDKIHDAAFDTTNCPRIPIPSSSSVQLLLRSLDSFDIHLRHGVHRSWSLVVDGAVIRMISQHDHLKQRFTKSCLQCRSVICCRVTPLQKSQMVSLVNREKFATLAIGDGGNDVSMIQEAHVGVGIQGREGCQASRAADFSIAQFKFLARLVLVHGRSSLLRCSFAALYCFYKSIFIAAIQGIYQFFCCFSGSSVFSSFALSSYNVLFTSLPVLCYALDRDMMAEQLLAAFAAGYSNLYQRSTLFMRLHSLNPTSFLLWVAMALVHALATLLVSVVLAGDFDAAIKGYNRR